MQAIDSVHVSTGPARARLYLGEVGSRVVADVAKRTAHQLTVTKRLPFLRLDSQVTDEEGRSARIAGVRVFVEDGTPTLLVELAYPSGSRRDATLPYGLPVPSAPTPSAILPASRTVPACPTSPAPRPRTVRGDSTRVFRTARREEDHALMAPGSSLVAGGDTPSTLWRLLARSVRALRALVLLRLRGAFGLSGA